VESVDALAIKKTEREERRARAGIRPPPGLSEFEPTPQLVANDVADLQIPDDEEQLDDWESIEPDYSVKLNRALSHAGGASSG